MSLRSGSRIGPYEILDAIGAGGMGEVYRARDLKLDRDVALKLLPESLAGNPDLLLRFEREAKTLASLNHPHIAQIFGIEEAHRSEGPGFSRAIVMELVEGEDLAARLARGPLAREEVLAIARQMAEALEAAHEAGIVHRDLKPANVRIRADGTVKVLDFGLAKAGGSDFTGATSGTGARAMGAVTSPAMTMHGMILGTAAYMSPEQASGKPVDKRADIWAFGVVVWEMLAGRRMFEGETISHVIAAVLTKDPDVSAVPPRFQRLLTRCLEKDPKKRLRDIGDAMSLVQDSDVVAPPASGWQRWRALGGWVAAGGAAAALALSLWWRPMSDVEANRPVVRFQIPRSAADIYNRSAAAFAVSPDGRLLAHYDAGSNGQQNLFVRTLDTGETREVAHSALIGPLPPFWSTDSRQLVYQTTTNTQIFDVSTGATRQLCACRFRGGTWNASGVILLGSGQNLREGIRRVSLASAEPVAVTSVDAGKGESDALPLFLPDGRRFLFMRSFANGGTATFLGTLDGEPPKQIAEGSRSLFVASLDGGGPHLLGIESAGLVAQALDAGAMTIRGEARLIVAGAAAGSVSQNGVLATSAPGRTATTVPTWFDRKGSVLGVVGEARVLQSVDLTSDGRRLAITDLPPGQRTDIWLRDLASGAYTRLTFDAEGDASPVWSPDGTRIVVSSARSGVVNLYERAADGTGSETRLFPSDLNEHANDWSRDGRWVIFTLAKPQTNTDLDLWVVTATGAQRKAMPYLTSSAREAQAQFSPDGRFVVYISDASGTAEVYVQSFPDASAGKWMISSGGGVEPRWSRDGKELFYLAGQTVMSVSVALQPTFASGSVLRLFEAPIQPGYVNDSHRWQVAPDGQRFLLLPADAGSNGTPPIDVVVNWEALLKR